MTEKNRSEIVEWAKDHEVGMEALNELLSTLGHEAIPTIRKVRVTVAFDVWTDDLDLTNVGDLEIDSGSLALCASGSLAYGVAEGYSPEFISAEVID